MVQAGIDALNEYGAGLSSVRFICGTQDIHKELENKISKFHSRDDTILYASCFDANAGLFEQLLGPEDAVLSDALNHASIIDGIRLCKAKKFRYNHKDMKGKSLIFKAALVHCILYKENYKKNGLVRGCVFSKPKVVKNCFT